MRSEKLELRWPPEQQQTSITAVGCCGGSWRKKLVDGHTQKKHREQHTQQPFVAKHSVALLLLLLLYFLRDVPTGAKRDPCKGTLVERVQFNGRRLAVLSCLASPSFGCVWIISYSSL